MTTRSLLLLALAVVPLLAAPTQTQNGQRQQGQDQGPPLECEKPFGEGKLATDPSPYNFTVVARQRTDVTDYKKTFKGAPFDLIINFITAPGAAPIQAFALRAGIPFPVVQWQKSADHQSKIVSCIAPQSVDTLLIKGQTGQSRAAVAVPLLAAWGNKQTLAVIYEMAIQGGNGQIYVTAFNGTLSVKETDYELPKQFFQPPSNANGQRGQSGVANMNDPRFRQQGMNMNMQRQQRDAADDQTDQAHDDDEEDGN